MKAWVIIDITKPGEKDVGVTVNLDMIWGHDDFEFEWEPDGEATYVPYGETSVLYDSGEGGLASVEVSADVDDYQFLDFEDTIAFFERVGTDGDNRQLAWNASTYTKGADSAKKIIDDIFNLAEDEETLKDMNEVLDVYFDKVFKHNKEEEMW